MLSHVVLGVDDLEKSKRFYDAVLGTIGFAVDSAELGDAFQAAGVANGGKTCEDPPGYREKAAGEIYLAYLGDPDGNRICALYRPQ